MKITVIHPSRNRPERAEKVFRQMISRADNPKQIEYIISIDNDEPQIENYKNISNDLFKHNTLVSDNVYCVGAINNAAKISTGNIIIVTSDDFDDWFYGWDSEIVKAIGNREECLLKTFDGSQKWMATLPIMTRGLYNKLGYIYNPLYKHMFVDTDLSCTCDLLGVTLYRNDIIIPHNHYSKMKDKDSTNERNDSTWDEGERIFFSRVLDNFGVKESEQVSKISDNRILAWIKTKL
jgi:hypothetical protein